MDDITRKRWGRNLSIVNRRERFCDSIVALFYMLIGFGLMHGIRGMKRIRYTYSSFLCYVERGRIQIVIAVLKVFLSC